jgi:hypothetical protein
VRVSSEGLLISGSKVRVLDRPLFESGTSSAPGCQGVSRRYERRSLVRPTNLPFSEWPGIFPNTATATALIDRVVHFAETITIEGESDRRRVAQARQKSCRSTSTWLTVGRQNPAVAEARPQWTRWCAASRWP